MYNFSVYIIIMNTYCLFYEGNEIGNFVSKVPFVSAKKICRNLFRVIDGNNIEKFSMKNKATGQIYHYHGKRKKNDSYITFKNGKTIHVKYKYYVKRIV